MEILILSLEQGDFSVIITSLDVILPRKSISGSHVYSSFYAPSDVVFLEEQPPPGLPAAEILGLFEVSQVLVIHYYGHQVFGSSKIVLPLL